MYSVWRCVCQRSIAEIGTVGAPLTASLPTNTHSENHVNDVDQTESTSADPHCLSSADRESPDNQLHSMDHADGHPQLENVDQLDAVHQSGNVDQVVSYYYDSSMDQLEPFHHSRNVDGYRQFEYVDQIESFSLPQYVEQVVSYHYDSSMDQPDPCHESQNVDQQRDFNVDQSESFNQSQCVDQVNSDRLDHLVDQVNSIDQSGNADQVDTEAEMDGHDQFRNVDQCADKVKPVLPTTTSVHHTAVVSTSDKINSMHSSTSVVKVCSIVGLAVVSLAVVIYILRRGRQSKAWSAARHQLCNVQSDRCLGTEILWPFWPSYPQVTVAFHHI